jgi:hypothetical protein
MGRRATSSFSIQERGPSPAYRRGRTSTTRGRSTASVVSSSMSGSLAQLALAQLPVPPPTAGAECGCLPSVRAVVALCALGTVQDVARRLGGVRVLGLFCPHSGTTPPRGGRCLPVREDLSGDLPVHAGAAAISLA